MPVVMQTLDQMISENLPADVVELHVTGKLHKDDYQELEPKLERLIAEYGKLRMLVVLTHFEGWDAAAMWEDVKMDFRHYSHFERIAVVGQRGKHHVLTELFKPFTAAKVRYFDVDELRMARAWISER